MPSIRERFETLPLLDRIFDASIILKGLDGLLELLGGVLVLLLSPDRLNAIVRGLTEHELSEDPKDFIATHAIHIAHDLATSVSVFLALYLLSHGLVKIVLVAALLKQKLWAYPWMIAFLVVFILYQIYRLVIHLSIGLTLLTLFDIFIVYLTLLEYRKHKTSGPTTPGSN